MNINEGRDHHYEKEKKKKKKEKIAEVLQKYSLGDIVGGQHGFVLRPNEKRILSLFLTLS